MTLTRATPGKPLRIPAGAYNAFCDAAEEFQRNGYRTGARDSSGGGNRSALIVSVSNGTGSLINQFKAITADYGVEEVLTIDGSAYAVASSPILKVSSFYRDTDDTNPHLMIAQEPINVGEIGTACIRGVCIAEVDIQSLDHRYAILPTGQNYLRSAFEGPVRILQRQTETLEVQACLVDLMQSLSSVPIFATGAVGSGSTQNWKDAVSFSHSLADPSAIYEVLSLELPAYGLYEIDLRVNCNVSASTQANINMTVVVEDESFNRRGIGPTSPAATRVVAETRIIPTSPPHTINLSGSWSHRWIENLPGGTSPTTVNPTDVPTIRVELSGNTATITGHASLTVTPAVLRENG